jgi:hypothetical protein
VDLDSRVDSVSLRETFLEVDGASSSVVFTRSPSAGVGRAYVVAGSSLLALPSVCGGRCDLGSVE